MCSRTALAFATVRAQGYPGNREMPISGEVFATLKEAGASDEKAEAAPALIAGHELRLNKLGEVLRWSAIAADPAAIAFMVILVMLR